jgi:hypothetical protein
MVSAISSTPLPPAQVVERRPPRPAGDVALRAQAPDQRSANADDRTQRTARVEPAETVAGGSIRFEMQSKTRVMQVFDSKDVLIYQVPPKGEIRLIREQEAAAEGQLLASA